MCGSTASARCSNTLKIFLAATRSGIRVSGICLANMAMTCPGFPFDPRKTFLFQEQMVILGAKLSMMWTIRGYHLCIEDDKRRRRRKTLSECWDEKQTEAGVASNCAGQLSWSATTIASEVGRAFLKPLHAQAHKPLPGGMMSPSLEQATGWWISYLDLAPKFFSATCGGWLSISLRGQMLQVKVVGYVQ